MGESSLPGVQDHGLVIIAVLNGGLENVTGLVSLVVLFQLHCFGMPFKNRVIYAKEGFIINVFVIAG